MGTPASPSPESSSSLKWWICGLLLLATTLNYMDRQALTQTQVRISSAFKLNDADYSWLIVAFNIGFGAGALLFGWLVDKVKLRWLYAALVVGWSAAGFATGFVGAFTSLLVCRLLLGIFEAGNWPCGIMTVKRVLKPEERSLGNGMFQSGTALGAILIPLVVLACFQLTEPDDPTAWQLPFRIIGVLGLAWVFLWLYTVRDDNVKPLPPAPSESPRDSYWDLWRDRRFYVMIVVIVGVNTPWRSFGEWMTKFLQKEKQYDETTSQLFTSAYFIAADVGSIGIGFLTLWLVRRGKSVHSSRMIAFGLTAGLTMLTVVAAFLPKGPMLMGVLLLIAFGSLGSFSSYFAFSQEISQKHQGKVTGTLGLINSLCMAGLGRLQGVLIQATGSYQLALGLTGLAPVLAFLALYFFWERPKPKEAAANGA